MRGLNLRVIVVGLLCGVLGLFVARALTRWFSEALIGRYAGRTMASMMDHGETTRCQAAPSSWSLQSPGFAETYAYDTTTLLSANPNAPPLDHDLLARANANPEWRVATKLKPGARGGVFVVRVGEGGACGILQSSWGAVATPRESALGAVLSAGAIALTSIVFSFLIVIRPAARRFFALSRAAACVGNEDTYVPAESKVEDDFGRLSKTLDATHERILADAQKLEAERGALEEHLANVAHDLRTPITSLHLAIEQALGATSNGPATEPLARALADVVYLRGLTENLRLASKYGRASVDSTSFVFDLAAVAQRSAARLQFLSSTKEISLEIATPESKVPVRGDPIAVEQAIGNVIDNAVTHGQAGGHIAVVLRLEADDFELTVVDDGPGVRISELPKLGERTYRSDESRQRDPRGSGLGLAITAEVARRAKWKLAFAAESPHGFRVTLRGPCATGEAIEV
jgi:signal transduction histidine kinase